MALLPVLLLAAPAGAFDYADEAFWSKRYQVPDNYCVVRIATEFRDVRAAGRELEGCGTPAPDAGRVDVQCRLPAARAEAIASALLKQGRLLAYDRQCREPDWVPELDYKRLHLKEEAERIALSTGPWAGLRGLLGAQMQLLDWLIARRDHAVQTALAVTVVPPGASAPAPPWRPDAAPPRPEEVLWHPWSRMSVSSCDQVPFIYAVFDAPAGSAAEKDLRSVVKALGTEADLSDCPRWEGRPPFAAVLSREPREEIRRRMTALPGLRRWASNPKRQSPVAVPDDEKSAALTADLQAAGAALAGAPHIAALARAELGRLRPTAERIAALRAGTLVVFQTSAP